MTDDVRPAPTEIAWEKNSDDGVIPHGVYISKHRHSALLLVIEDTRRIADDTGPGGTACSVGTQCHVVSVILKLTDGAGIRGLTVVDNFSLWRRWNFRKISPGNRETRTLAARRADLDFDVRVPPIEPPQRVRNHLVSGPGCIVSARHAWCAKNEHRRVQVRVAR